jgi:hypothetical protein
MYRYIYPYLALIFVPAAVFLLIAGVRVLRLDKRFGFGLKLALIVNTSLAIVLGWFGSAKAEQPDVLCYAVLAVNDEPVPKTFNESDGWNDLACVVPAYGRRRHLLRTDARPHRPGSDVG